MNKLADSKDIMLNYKQEVIKIPKKVSVPYIVFFNTTKHVLVCGIEKYYEPENCQNCHKSC